MRLQAGTRLAHYEILAPRGAGGMGEVYRARDARLDRDVAIKVLPERLANSCDALARFEREAKALAALSHPNLVPIFHVGTDHAISFAVMELLVGETLLACLCRGSQSSIPSRFPRWPRTGAATGSAALPLHHAEPEPRPETLKNCHVDPQHRQRFQVTGRVQ